MSNGSYDDIIHLPYPQPGNRARMSRVDRGAQFSPFAALVGFDAAIAETARRTEDPVELMDSGIDLVDEKLRRLCDLEKPQVTVIHFLPDQRKSGGAYVHTAGTVKKVDICEKTLVLTDGTAIPFSAIIDIDMDIFL